MTELRVGDVARLKKRHPCGGFEWEVVRLGAEIGLRCVTCDRRILMTRRELQRRMKSLTAENQGMDLTRRPSR